MMWPHQFTIFSLWRSTTSQRHILRRARLVLHNLPIALSCIAQPLNLRHLCARVAVDYPGRGHGQGSCTDFILEVVVALLDQCDPVDDLILQLVEL